MLSNQTQRGVSSTTVAVIILIIVLGAGATYVISSKSASVPEAAMVQDEQSGAMMEDKNAIKETGAMQGTAPDTVVKADDTSAMSGETAGMMKTGAYEPYDPKLLANAAVGDVVLFFRASWCPTCRAVDADIRAHLNAIPKGVTILDVDYDNSDTLKRKYNVVYQHTFVQVDKDGNQITKWSGSATLADIVKHVQ